MKNTFIAKTVSAVLLLVIVISALSCSAKVIEYEIHTDLQKQYIEGDYSLFAAYASGKEELSRPLPVTLEIKGSTVSISENSDMSYSTEYAIKDGKAEIYNLKTGCEYYYSADGGKTVKFIVSSTAPRNLMVEGVTNARDIGGYKTANGIVKQGMIYRSAKLTDDYTGEKLISDGGIETLKNTLKIKTELDLRRIDNGEQGGISSSVLGDDVTYISYPMLSSGNVLTLNKDLLHGIFVILGNKDNYPIIMHCSIGTDRTGMVAFIANALLGVSEDDLYRDYLFSNFADIGRMRTASAVDDYIRAIDSANGDTIAEKTKNYLISAGVEEKDINSFIEIMKG